MRFKQGHAMEERHEIGSAHATSSTKSGMRRRVPGGLSDSSSGSRCVLE